MANFHPTFRACILVSLNRMTEYARSGHPIMLGSIIPLFLFVRPFTAMHHPVSLLNRL